MTDKHPIRNSIIASVAAGIILAALGRIWPPAWAILSARVAAPVWVLALITLALLGFILLTVRFRRAGVPKVPEISAERLRAANAPTKGRGASNISLLGRAVLARIVKADGEPVPQDTIKRSLGTTNLGLQAIVDELVALDLIEVLEEVDGDEVVLLLTARGRQYALGQRLV